MSGWRKVEQQCGQGRCNGVSISAGTWPFWLARLTSGLCWLTKWHLLICVTPCACMALVTCMTYAI